MQLKLIDRSIAVILATIGAQIQLTPVAAQLIPQPWVTVGSKNSTFT